MTHHGLLSATEPSGKQLHFDEGSTRHEISHRKQQVDLLQISN
jgi:hypothetical protein